VPVRLDLFPPELGVVGRPGHVVWASVPEAAIDEHHNSGWPEDDVGPTSHTGKNGTVDAVAKTASVERSSQRKFWLGVSRTSPSHSFARRG
jgi:hypothetical protein